MRQLLGELEPNETWPCPAWPGPGGPENTLNPLQPLKFA
jgi:hypothetical protein